MKIIRLIFISLFIFSSLNTLSGQTREVKRKQQQTEKTDKQQKKEYEKLRKKKIKERKQMQTKAVRKRMRRTARSAKKFNDQNQPSFIEKIFRKKPKNYGRTP